MVVGNIISFILTHSQWEMLEKRWTIFLCPAKMWDNMSWCWSLWLLWHILESQEK